MGANLIRRNNMEKAKIILQAILVVIIGLFVMIAGGN